MFVKPAPGRKVRHPETKRHLPESGKEVPESPYWMRRLSEGDVVLAMSEPQVVDPDSYSDSSDPEGQE